MCSTFFKTSIKSVLIADNVDDKCGEILRNNGLTVVKNTSLTKDQLLEEVKKYDCIVVRSATKVTSDVLESGANNLKLIARAGTGVDNIDVNAASEKGMLVMNAVGSNTISACELTCSMICSLPRNMTRAIESMRQGKWERSKLMGNELYGKTLAIIGLGRIGREVASRMQSFGMKTIGYDPFVKPEDSIKWGIEFKSLEECWPIADFITIHVPLMPETKHMFNKTVFNKCKKGFRIVNCARGGIIDEVDLLDCLKSGHCAGAGLDVFEEEPTKSIELCQHPNALCTPHLGASTVEAQDRVAIDIAEQIVQFAKNQKTIGGVNESKLIKL
jgi:D-3-phosphoglycerate dehydrogenase / 2-oxoglutarate reductase